MASSNCRVYGWVGAAKISPRRTGLDELALAHHSDLVGDLPDDGKVMRDEQIGNPELGLQVGQQPQDLRLDPDVERGNRFVQHHQIRSDASALAIATRCR